MVVAVIAVGWIFGRAHPEARRGLANLVYLVATPALIFDILLRTDPRDIFSANFLVIAGSALLAGALGFLAFRVRGRSSPDSLIGMLASSYANAGNLGVPLAVYILDDAAVVIPVILFQVAFYAPFTLTTLDMLHRSRQSTLLRNMVASFRNPMLLAAVAGLLIGFLRIRRFWLFATTNCTVISQPAWKPQKTRWRLLEIKPTKKPEPLNWNTTTYLGLVADDYAH